MTTQDDEQNKCGRAVAITQTLVLSAPPLERAAAPDLQKTRFMGSTLPETVPPEEPVHLAKTQLLPVDIANMRVRGAAIIHGRPGSNDGKTQLLWAGQMGGRHPLAKTQPISRTVIVEAKRSRAVSGLAQLGRWIRRPEHLRATIAAASVVLGCYATWTFTAQTEVSAGAATQPRVAPAPTTTSTSASTSVDSSAYAVAASADPPAVAAVGVAALKPGSVPSTERAAVDALYTGDYSLAAHHYGALAGAHPNNRVYVEALRILRRATTD